MTQAEFLADILQRLNAAGIASMIAGSHASSFHGQPRATHDVDIVIDPSPQQLEQLLALLGETYYVSQDAAREALRRRSMFNVINSTEGWKADLIIRKDRAFSVEEFRRRQAGHLYGLPLYVASAEDVILSKLEWHSISTSERQLLDAMNVAVTQWSRLDFPYLRDWAVQLNVAPVLEELLLQAAELVSRSSN